MKEAIKIVEEYITKCRKWESDARKEQEKARKKLLKSIDETKRGIPIKEFWAFQSAKQKTEKWHDIGSEFEKLLDELKRRS